jgi:cyclohexa-1,5-dienecarbonyl-CoA hydratase
MPLTRSLKTSTNPTPRVTPVVVLDPVRGSDDDAGMSALVSVEPVDAGAIWRVTFGQPPGNILDRATMRALSDTFHEARKETSLKAVCLAGAGEHFSYGASIQEHLPDEVSSLLAAVHQLVMSILESHLVVVSAVRGCCLGGGLELATLSHRIVAEPGATFAQPEIALGVFAPVASIVLALRIGQAAAEDLCLTGRTVAVDEAQRLGLVDEVAKGAVMDAAVDWARRTCGPRSARSLRYAVQAVRARLLARVDLELPELNRLYLDGLMSTADAVEGVQAFLEKRAPNWVNE